MPMRDDALRRTHPAATYIGGEPSKYFFVIPGPPRTKKTHNRIILAGGRQRVLPSKAFEQWQKDAGYFINNAKACWPHGEFPLPFRLNCRALFWRHANVGDAVGFYQALADCLQHYGIVKNDALIVSWNGSELLKDASSPRVEVTLEVL